MNLTLTPTLFSRLMSLAVGPEPVVRDLHQERAAATVAALCQELPELLSVAVIDLASSKTLAFNGGWKNMRPDKAANYYVRLVQEKQRTIEALGLVQERIEEVVVNLREQIHLLRLSHDGNRLLFLAVDAEDTNLALARTVLKDYSN